jgi:hypothetical protein
MIFHVKFLQKFHKQIYDFKDATDRQTDVGCYNSLRFMHKRSELPRTSHMSYDGRILLMCIRVGRIDSVS